MTLDSDILIDRRRLKRNLTVWRVLAILAVVAAIAFASLRKRQRRISVWNRPRPHRARYRQRLHWRLADSAMSC